MPFVEQIAKSANGGSWIAIKAYGRITVSKELYDTYFQGKKIRLFFDDEHKLIGLKPDVEGYSIFLHYAIWEFKCMKFLRYLNQTKYYPTWSDKHQMLIIVYE